VSCRRHPRAATSLGDEKRRESPHRRKQENFLQSAQHHTKQNKVVSISLTSHLSCLFSRLASRVSHAPEPAHRVAQKGERRVHARARSAARYLPKKKSNRRTG
jgi:hypothetical protein